MNVLPLDQIGLGPRSHVSALWWLWLLYRAPDRFNETAKIFELSRQFRTDTILWLHALPHVVWVVVTARMGIIWFGMGRSDSLNIENGLMIFIILGILFCIFLPFASSPAFRIAWGIVYVTTFGIAWGTTYGVALAAAIGIAIGIATSIEVFKILDAFPDRRLLAITLGNFFLIVLTIFAFANGSIRSNEFRDASFPTIPDFPHRFPIGQIDANFSIGIGSSIAFEIALGIGVTRAFYIILHPCFVWPSVKGTWYRWHPVAWDQRCLMTFPKFDLLLTAFAEFDRQAGTLEIERFITEYPSQRNAALSAQTRLIARDTAELDELSKLVSLVERLPEGERGFLAQTADVKAAAAKIQQQFLTTVAERLSVFRRQQAGRLREEINQFRSRIAGFAEPLASEFRAAATKWLSIAERLRSEADAAAAREQVPQVFRAGDPVDRANKEAFVPRLNVIQDLASQILSSTGCPGLLLYARRRMGKSTCLNNLFGFLPSEIEVVSINMQSPKANATQTGFCRHVADRILEVTKLETPSELPNDVVTFERFLDAVQTQLTAAKRTVLVGVDEYEYLDKKLAERVFSEDLLGLLRTSIQTHRRIIWLLAGSHRITELKGAEWPSYLISMRTVELDRFSPQETYELLTEPVRYSRLWTHDDPRRPRFAPEFWGSGGIERIRREADGWPHLVQLLAETAVDQVNRLNVPDVSAELLEEICSLAVVRGENVMIQLLQNESELPGEWDYLQGFADHESQPPPSDPAILLSLRRRSLVAIEGDLVRFRIPLMRRWMRERAGIL